MLSNELLVFFSGFACFFNYVTVTSKKRHKFYEINECFSETIAINLSCAEAQFYRRRTPHARFQNFSNIGSCDSTVYVKTNKMAAEYHLTWAHIWQSNVDDKHFSTRAEFIIGGDRNFSICPKLVFKVNCFWNRSILWLRLTDFE